jgi:hypothetical protein
MRFLLLILSLPTQNATARMRAWRTLKASGAAVLRDGVYLLPEATPQRQLLDEVAADVQDSGGSARVLAVDDAHRELAGEFDRSADYAELIALAHRSRPVARAAASEGALKATRKLRKTLEQIAAIDFFPGATQTQARAAIEALEAAAARASAPGEPRAAVRGVARVALADYQGRVWATRKRPWVDRLASAWLIRRFIDPAARFKWLADTAACPKRAVGFDFDGATFSHVGQRVTFETLLASFGLETPALLRLGLLVHGLDAGGVLPAEAAGVETVLAGLRDAISNDDALLAAASAVFDALHASFEKEAKA